MERQSVIAERCTTCGSLLPCDLHDRKVKQSLLNEKPDPPGIEKVWEAQDENRVFRHVLRLNENTFVCGDSETGSVILKRSVPDQAEWRLHPFWINGGSPFQELNTLALSRTENGRILNVESKLTGVCLELFANTDEQSFEWNNTNSLTLKQDGMVHQISEEGEGSERLMPLTNDTFLLAFNSSLKRSQHFLKAPLGRSPDYMRLGLVKVNEIENKLEYRPLMSVEGKILTEFDQSDFIVDFARLPNGDFILSSGHHSLIRLFSSPDGSEKGWDMGPFMDEKCREELEADDGIADNLTPLSKDEIIMSLRNGKIGMVERDEYETGGWKYSVLNHDLRKTNSLNCNFAVFSPDTFFACWENGEIEKWTCAANGDWQCESLDLGLVTADNPMITPITSNPPSFLLFNGTRISFWQIPPEKILAYHERIAAQTEVPSLPLDI